VVGINQIRFLRCNLKAYGACQVTVPEEGKSNAAFGPLSFLICLHIIIDEIDR
jgi:hypothetical protein